MVKVFRLAMTCAVLCLFVGCGQVDAGHTGLKLSWGEVVSEPLGPGLWFFNPIGGALVTYDCREQRVDFKMNAYTKDVQSAEFQIAGEIPFHIAFAAERLGD